MPLAAIEALQARFASPPPEGVALSAEEALTLIRGITMASTMALAERDRYRLAWLSARRRAVRYGAENAQIEGLQNGIHNYEQWLAEEHRKAEALQAQVARIRAFLEDMAGWCSPHGVAADYARRALDALDGVDPVGLAGPTREEQP